MRSTAIALFIALFALAASAQTPAPIIRNIEPASGPVAGGTRVTITGENLDPLCPPYMVGCHDLLVKIGGKEAAIVERSLTRIVVVTPANNSGATDLEVRTNGGTARLARAFTYGATDRRRILLPVLIDQEIAGAQGSRWKTELAGFEHGSGAFTPSITTDRPGKGRFFYVENGLADAITLNLRARDLSRESENLGTEIPVVTAEQTFTSAIMPLLNIPMQQNYRQKVRIYDFEGEYGRNVIVRVYADGSLVLTREVKLSEGPTGMDYPDYPGQAEVDLDQIPELSGFSRVTVTVETPQEGRFWAFATITNNDTQLITTVTP
ncbi:MAG TPA: IPT/TIG domain-containing protein [Thermoanaerobaculia bacterium]|nr:IPT/TIG domain-containing protein [Thermoanaerobaculia bacterium]